MNRFLASLTLGLDPRERGSIHEVVRAALVRDGFGDHALVGAQK